MTDQPPLADKPQPRTQVDLVRGAPGGDGGRPEWDLSPRLPREEPAELRNVRLSSALVAELEHQARVIEQRGAVVPRALTDQLVEARASAQQAEFTVQSSSQIDPWIYAYGQGWAIPPLVDPLLATKCALASDALTVCVETMGRGVGGHGYELVPRIGDAAYKLLTPEERKDIEEEKLRIERWFTNANPDIPFVEVYRQTVQMKETTAFAAWELLPDEHGQLCGIEPMPSAWTRITPDAEEVLVPVPIQLDDGSWGHRLQRRRLRRVIMLVNGRPAWFKFLGDPRFIDRATGRIIGNEWVERRVVGDAEAVMRTLRQAEEAHAGALAELREARTAPPAPGELERIERAASDAERRLEVARRTAAELDPQRAAAQSILDECKRLRLEGREAHEVLMFKHIGVSGGTTPYGVTRWNGATYSALGRMKQQQAGYLFWDNNGIPRIVVTVAGAMLDPAQVKKIEDYFRGIKGIEHLNDVLVIQAMQGGPGSPDPYNEARGQVKITIERLNTAVLDEASFRASAKDWLNDVRRAFGLPPILTGDSDDYARAVADTARLIAEELVFQPERTLFDDSINRQLFPRLGFRHWSFKTGGAHISDEESVVSLLELLHKAAAASTEEIRELATTKLGRRLPAIGHPWAQQPSAYNGALATTGKGANPALQMREPADPGAPGNAAVPADDPDTDPAEVEGDGSQADVEAEQAGEAVDSTGGGKAPGKRRELVVEVPAAALQAEALATAEGLLQLRGAIEQALAMKAGE